MFLATLDPMTDTSRIALEDLGGECPVDIILLKGAEGQKRWNDATDYQRAATVSTILTDFRTLGRLGMSPRQAVSLYNLGMEMNGEEGCDHLVAINEEWWSANYPS